MKKSFNFLSVVLCAIVCSFCLFSTACSCSEMEAKIVHDNFVEFIESDNGIFKFNEDNIAIVDISYQTEVLTALNNEKQYYEEWEANKDNTGYISKFSDFYIIKVIYEPMLSKSISQISTGYKLLKNQSNEIDRHVANSINEALKKVQNSTSDLNDSIRLMNSNKGYFAPYADASLDTYGYGADYRNPNKNMYGELKNIKKSYENLIRDCYILNNYFMEAQLSVLPTYQFKDFKIDEFNNAELNTTMLLVADNTLNYMASLLSYVSFMIDGNMCSFITSSESFMTMYTNRDHATSKTFADKFKYTEHYDMIKDLTSFNLSDKAASLSGTYNESTKGALILDCLIACQNRFESFSQQLTYFDDAIKNVNYKKFVQSNTTDMLEYAKTLSGEERIHFLTVQEFIENQFTPLATVVSAMKYAIDFLDL